MKQKEIITFKLYYCGHLYNKLMVNLDDELFVNPEQNHSFVIHILSFDKRPSLGRVDLPIIKAMFKKDYLNTVLYTYNGVDYTLEELID